MSNGFANLLQRHLSRGEPRRASRGAMAVLALTASLTVPACVVVPPDPEKAAVVKAPPVTPGVALGQPQEFFDPQGIHQVALTLPADQWKKYLDRVENPVVDAAEVYVEADVTIDGASYGKVGIKDFGVGSQILNPEKPNIRIKFDEIVPEAEGPEKLDNLRLKAAGQDPTFLREQLANDLVRAAGGHSPRWSWARVSVNGKAYGLYIALEHVDKRMYKRLFDNKDGNQYDPMGGCLALNCPAKGCDGLKSYYEADPGDFTTLIQLAKVVHDAPDSELLAKMEPLANVDGLLALYAVEALASNYDGLLSAGHNFRIYQDSATGKLNFFGRSMDLSFGVWEVTYDIKTPWGEPNTWCKNRNDKFYSRAWSSPQVKEKLMAKFRTLQCGAMRPDAAKAWLRDMRSRIHPERMAEVSPTFTPAEEAASYVLLENYIDQRGKELEKLLGKCPAPAQ